MAEPTGRSLTIYGSGGVQTDLDLDSLGEPEVADVIPDLLADYAAECKDWTFLAGEHWRQKRWDRALDLLGKAIQQFRSDPVALSRLHTTGAHLQLALARGAPKAAIAYAKYDKLDPQIRTKEFYYTEATVHLNRANEAHQAAGGAEEPTALTFGKILLYLARGQPALAHPMVDALLARQPTNLIALLAQARLQFARRAHAAAFETYQRVLSLKPDMSPDPRIGLGICAWVAGDQVRAKMAWEKALKREPDSWVPLLLLGLSALNLARDPSLPSSQRASHEAEGVSFVQRAFKLNVNSPASAIALASITGQQAGKIAVASKLAERAIQYADNKRHSVLANAERGRLAYVNGDVGEAGPFIAAAKGEEQGVNVLAELTLGQIAIKNGNLREALNFIEQTAKRLPTGGPLEFTVLHASLLNYPHPGMTPDELSRNRLTARTMLSNLHKTFVDLRSGVGAPTGPSEAASRLRIVGQDPEVFLELGKMWMDESLDKAGEAYEAAVAVAADLDIEVAAADSDLAAANGTGNGTTKKVDLRSLKMNNNLGVLYQLQGNVETAERMYQDALSRIAGAGDAGEAGDKYGKSAGEAEKMRTVLAFNLGRAYEERGDHASAGGWYRDVLKQHPEHMESKVRLAAIAASQGRNVDAHNLLKECLKADETSLSLRSVYTHFLISLGSYREALAFTSQTLKMDGRDPYTFCALGWLHFALGREAKSSSELAERAKQYLRSSEAYERALGLDSNNAMAAQGLAILLAEDALLLPEQTKGRGAEEEMKSRMRAAGAALGVLSRINDSIQDGSTSVNMGHCYFVRNEEEKAIQAYEAAENHFKGRNVSNLLYLSRAWYAYATRDLNYSAMGKSLAYAQRAMHIQPSDRAILYNIAMIQQKAAEMLLAIEPSKRTSDELKEAVLQAQHAANTFRALADDKVKPLPYDVDLADQRARYGDGLLRKAPEQMERQRVFEAEATARVEEARRVRREEEERIRLASEARAKELADRQALIHARRQEQMAEEEAFQRSLQLQTEQADEERRLKSEKIADKRRRREAGEDVDGGAAGGTTGAPREKKKREKKKKEPRKGRSKSEISTDSDVPSSREASGTPVPVSRAGGDGEEEEEEDEGTKRRRGLERMKAVRQKKAKKSKRVDPDEDDAPRKSRDAGKYKSKDVIDDSDDDAEQYDLEHDNATADTNGLDADQAQLQTQTAEVGEVADEMEVDDNGSTAAQTPAADSGPLLSTSEGDAGRSPTPERSPTPPPREGGMDLDDDDDE